MKVAISLGHKFFLYKGCLYDNTVYHRSFWDPYVEVFGEITIVARVKEVSSISPAFKRVDVDGVAFFALNDYSSGLKSLKPLYENVRLLKSFAITLDGAIFRSPCLIGNILWFFVLKSNIPYSVELAGDIKDISKTPSTITRKILRRFIFYNIVKKQCRHADVTNYVTDRYLQHRYPNKDSTRMYSWSTIQLPEVHIAKKHRCYNNHQGLVFVYTANFISYKGHAMLIDTFHALNSTHQNWRLILIGEGKIKKSILDKVEKYNLQDKIVFTGSLPNEKVREILGESDVYISSSLTEGLPRGVIEATAQALPVTGFNVGGINEIVHPKYLVEPGNLKELKLKLVYFLNNFSELNEISKKNLERASYYSKENTLAKRRISYKKFFHIIASRKDCLVKG